MRIIAAVKRANSLFSINSHETYMRRCLQLASKGLGHVAPNPMVGCVIVHNHCIVAEGWHEYYGGPHAEPNAIHQVGDDVLRESTLYVNLEPCSHYGKTPPCANLIRSKGIQKVVVGHLDPNPLVAGKGIQGLRDAGIEVEQGVLEKECRALNKRFLTLHEKKRPYIILKWAQTRDGYLSRFPLPNHQEDNWITGKESKVLVHQWRSQEQAILVGHNTALWDNPYLTTRLVAGKHPIRLVITKTPNDLPQGLNVLNTEAPTIVFNGMEDGTNGNVQYVKINLENVLEDLLNECYVRQISSIIVEGGASTLNQFIRKNTWDEARILVNPNQDFGSGIEAPTFNLHGITPMSVGHDLVYFISNETR